jgi:PAS domain S-box-containing protein
MAKSKNLRLVRKNTKTESNPHLSDESFRLLVSRVKDYAIFMLDPEGNVASWNEGAERIKGYTANEIVGSHMSIFYTPEDRRRRHPLELLNEARTKGRVEEEGWRLKRDGSRFWADVTITALFDDEGVLRGFGKVTRDLTDRKRAEDALADLSSRLLQIQDSERRRVSRDLHDTTSPLLTSLTAKLYTARLRTRNKDPEMAEVVDQTLALCEATTTMIRTISSMLHPALLEQSGLIATLRWYLEAIANRTGMRVETQLPEQSFRMEPEIEISLFRLTQEWLNGMLLRGDRSAILSLTVVSGKLELRVESRGPTWEETELNDLNSGRGTLGVFVSAMRQRLRQSGGSIAFKLEDSSMVLSAVVPRRLDR